MCLMQHNHRLHLASDKNQQISYQNITKSGSLHCVTPVIQRGEEMLVQVCRITDECCHLEFSHTAPATN